MRVTNWRNIFVDQGQFSNSDFISGTYQMENVKFTDNENDWSVWGQAHYDITDKNNMYDNVCFEGLHM